MTVRDHPSSTAASPATAYRLPAAAVPRRYELHLIPHLKARRFEGTERIELEVVERAEGVVCNADELEIGAAELWPGWASAHDEPGEPRPLSVELDVTNERVRFVPGEPIEPGRYTLACAFTGILNEKLRGFYPSTFVDDNGDEQVIATTQFEETSARNAFPCFDEPELKAVFSVTLDAPPGTLALSNGAELAVEDLDGGWRRVRFADTIPMSTYLVAFVVGPLEVGAPRSVGAVPVRIAHVPGRARLTGPALEAAEHALGFFSKYFGLDYPGDKLDLVALPDFASGAMENLGCITFREAILLADPERLGRADLERLSEVVEHELAHMWFGDLVTMRWWDGIWLNEAFATFMALRCQDDFHPEWEVFTSFARSRSVALGVDGLHCTRPIEYPVREPEDAAAMFDTLTYEKGASVLWMAESYLGPERFRAGVREYLAAHTFKSTDPADLWEALGAAASEVPVRSMMETWLLQGGYPLVSASALGDGVELRQEPFAYLPAEAAAGIGTLPGDGSAIGSRWLVPILFRTAGGPDGRSPEAAADQVGRVLLGAEPVRLARPAAGEALVLNAGGTGFYRVAYDATLRGDLLANLDRLGTLERFNLLSDTWAAVLSGRDDLAELLDLAVRLDGDESPQIWWLLASVLDLVDLVAGEDERHLVADRTRSLLGPQLARVGWERRPGEAEQAPLLRSTLVLALGTTGEDEAVVSRARELFAEDHFGGDPVDRDLAGAVLGAVVAHASAEELAAILDRWRRPRDPMDGIRHLYALGRLRDRRLVEEVLALTLSEVRSQNAPILIGAMLSNREPGELAFGFLKDRWQEMRRRFPDNLIPRMLEGVSGLAQLDGEGRPRHAAEVRAFCGQAVSGPRGRLVDQSLERLEVNVRLAQRLRGRLAGILGA